MQKSGNPWWVAALLESRRLIRGLVKASRMPTNMKRKLETRLAPNNIARMVISTKRPPVSVHSAATLRLT